MRPSQKTKKLLYIFDVEKQNFWPSVISPNNMSGFYTRKVSRRKKNTNLRILFLLCNNSSKVEFHKKIIVPFLWQFQLDVEN